MKRPKRSTVTSVAAIVVAASVAFAAGSVVTALSSPEPVTYYACLRGGMMRRVGTTSPTCGQRSELISWNQSGPAGPSGPPGPTGPAGPPGPANSSVYVLNIEVIATEPLPLQGGVSTGIAPNDQCTTDGAPDSPGCHVLYAAGVSTQMIARYEAVPSRNWVWSGDAASCGSSDLCPITMDSDKFVTITFSPPTP